MRVAAVDFDGTINAAGWCGRPGVYAGLVPGCKRGMDRLRELGFKIIIWTCRGGEDAEIAAWLTRHEIPFDAINQNVVTNDNLFPGFTRSQKVIADVYFDDRSACWKGWRRAMHMLEMRLHGGAL